MYTKIAMTFALATAMTALAVDAAQAATSKSGVEQDTISQHAVPSTLMAREAGEAPRGRDNERPGDRQRGRNKNTIDKDDQLAREANEPPRGEDNNRNRRNRGKG